MNAETSALIEASKGWRELKNAAEAGRLPQSAGVVLPSVMQETFVEMYGRLLLGEDDLWKDGTHPDLVSAGNASSPPSIDECRRLQGEISLHPLTAQRRLAVIWRADRLSQEASNSLLKITEEPPVHGSILFISEEDNLLPTIKSRIWRLYIELPEEIAKGRPMPSTLEEWAQWMDASRKPGLAVLCLEIQGWVRELASKNEYKRAAELDSLSRIAEQRNLSAAVIEDMVFAICREEVPYEKILGGIW